MKTKILFAFLVMAVSLTSYGQKEEVVKKMVEYGFSEKDIDIKISQEDPNYSFKMRTTTKTGDDTSVEESTFDPTMAEGQKWKLESVNGNAPSSKELKNFNKSHNGKKQDIQGIVSDDYNITEDNDKFFILKFRYDRASLRKKDQYLANCHGLEFFNKETKRIDKVEFLNDGELKIKIFKITKLDMVQNLTYNEADNEYFIDTETLLMDAKLFGQIVSVESELEYYDYKKVGSN